MSRKSKTKTSLSNIFIMLFSFCIGCGLGVLFAKSIFIQTAGKSVSEQFFYLFCLIIAMYIALFAQVIIHEAGHLIFGLLTGYKFSSFRIFNFIFIKENKQIKLKRYSLAGTAGQCLMSPPEETNRNTPVILYNLGGVIANAITGFIFILLYFVTDRPSILSSIILTFSVFGFFYAIANGIPLKLKNISNDGSNVLSLVHNKEAIRCFRLQMKISEETAKGIRLKDMPAEWFILPSDEAIKNKIVAAIGVFACNRLMDEKNFEEADLLMKHLLETDNGMEGLHKKLLICDRLYCELISQNRKNIIDNMLNNEQKVFMRKMKNSPSIIRTEYLLALISEKNEEKAEKLKTIFEKCAKTHPYQGDIQSERELIEFAEQTMQL